jgi:hypothetical protein
MLSGRMTWECVSDISEPFGVTASIAMLPLIDCCNDSSFARARLPGRQITRQVMADLWLDQGSQSGVPQMGPQGFSRKAASLCRRPPGAAKVLP